MDGAMEQEIWKDIKGFEGCYQISSHGRVKSLERKVGSRWDGIRTVKEKIRKPMLDKVTGAYKVMLISKAGSRNVGIANLVAESFLLNTNNLPKLAWLYGDKTNNHVSNLEYQKLKFTRKGHRGQKLAPSDIPKIRNRISSGESNSEIAKSYSVRSPTINHIRKSITWVGY